MRIHERLMAKSMLVNVSSALNGGDNLQSHGNGDEGGGTCAGARLRVQVPPRVDHSE